MLKQPLRAYLLVGGIEPTIDALDPEALRTLAKAELVVAITPFASEEMKAVAHIMLPMGTFAETSGTYVNCEGRWQSQSGAATPVGECRPGWKVLRVLGNLMQVGGFEYQSSEEVLSEVRARCAEATRAPTRVRTRSARYPRARTMPGSSTCRCIRPMHWCDARPRCSARAKAARRS